jgi:hypothetical protein
MFVVGFNCPYKIRISFLPNDRVSMTGLAFWMMLRIFQRPLIAQSCQETVCKIAALVFLFQVHQAAKSKE